MKLVTFLMVFFASSFSFAETKLKSLDCVYKSGPNAEYKVASIEYVGVSKLKSIWLAPSMNANHMETIYVDGCRRQGRDYLCSNPVYDDEFKAAFDGEILKVKIDKNKATIYSCSVPAEVKKVSLHCMQSKPNTVWGYIVDDAQVEINSSEPKVQINSMGIGIINQEGDGSVSDVLVSSEKFLEPDYSKIAKSKQWKDATPFVLESKEKKDTEFVLYLDPKAFSGPQDKDFPGRLRVTENSIVKNYTLYCVHN